MVIIVAMMMQHVTTQRDHTTVLATLATMELVSTAWVSTYDFFFSKKLKGCSIFFCSLQGYGTYLN